MTDRIRTAVLLAVQAAGLALAFWTGSPPPVVGADAPSDRFSGARARQTLSLIMGDGRPRPTGSAASAEARARIVESLTSLGYTPEVQSSFVCGPFRQYCAQVHNVMARLNNGSSAGKAVLVNAHYDSAAASPGAADCLAGVAAALEVAAVFRAHAPGSDVIFLFNDGEEIGLLGATAFVESHRWARDVSSVVNLEARGSGGPSWPVYSVGDDLGMMRAYLATAARPAPGSAALAATAGLPLANDIAVFERLGVPGMTMGFARHPRRYHTALDDLGHLSADSLQQHGQNALGLARAMAATPPAPSVKGVYVGVGPIGVAWPASWSMTLTAAASIGILLALLMAWRRAQVSVRQLLWGLAGWPVAIIVVFFAAAAVNAARRSVTEIVSANVSFPLPSFLGFCFLGLAGILLIAPWLNRRAGAGLWFGTWMWWSALTVLAAASAPQAAYLLLVPLVAAALSCWGVCSNDARVRLVTTVVPAAVVTLVWYPNLVLLYDLAGIGNLPPMAGIIATAATTTMPLVAGRAGRMSALTIAAAGLALVAWGTRVPTFTDDDPQFANVLYHLDADSGEARWAFTGYPLPGPMAAAVPFGEDSVRLLSWSSQDAGVAAPAPGVPLPAPQLDALSVVSSGAGEVVTGRLVSRRDAPVIQMAFAADSAPAEVTVAGVRVPSDAAPFPLYDASVRVYTIWTLPPGGVEVTMRFEAVASGSVTLVDRSYGLPPEGGALISARPAWSSQVGPGDQSIVSTRVALAGNRVR
jgi:hypothetical protein